MAEFARLVTQRDAYKRERDDYQSKLSAYESRSEVEAYAAVEAERDEFKARFAELEQKQQQAQLVAQRQATADAILNGAHPNKRDEFGLILDGLAARGEISLDDPNKADSIREALAKKMPGYFGPAEGSSQPGVPGPQGLDLNGLRYEDMTPEMRSSLSAEQMEAVLGLRKNDPGKIRI